MAAARGVFARRPSTESRSEMHTENRLRTYNRGADEELWVSRPFFPLSSRSSRVPVFPAVLRNRNCGCPGLSCSSNTARKRQPIAHNAQAPHSAGLGVVITGVREPLGRLSGKPYLWVSRSSSHLEFEAACLLIQGMNHSVNSVIN